MKKLMLSFALMTASIGAFAQVFAGSQELEKGVNRDGAYTSTPIKEKFIVPSWKTKLAEFGRIEESKGVMTITEAKMSEVSADPVMIQSKVFTKSGRTTVFMAVSTGNNEFITANHPKYGAVEKVLNDFLEKINLEEAVRVADKEFADTQDKQQDVSKAGEKLLRKIENNKKDKENYEKKLVENKQELEKLLSDIEQNKKDQIKSGEDVELKKKAVEAAKARLSGGGKQ
jgi:Mg-chelatase subunit ChlI